MSAYYIGSGILSKEAAIRVPQLSNAIGHVWDRAAIAASRGDKQFLSHTAPRLGQNIGEAIGKNINNLSTNDLRALAIADAAGYGRFNMARRGISGLTDKGVDLADRIARRRGKAHADQLINALARVGAFG